MEKQKWKRVSSGVIQFCEIAGSDSWMIGRWVDMFFRSAQITLGIWKFFSAPLCPPRSWAGKESGSLAPEADDAGLEPSCLLLLRPGSPVEEARKPDLSRSLRQRESGERLSRPPVSLRCLLSLSDSLSLSRPCSPRFEDFGISPRLSEDFSSCRCFDDSRPSLLLSCLSTLFLMTSGRPSGFNRKAVSEPSTAAGPLAGSSGQRWASRAGIGAARHGSSWPSARPACWRSMLTMRGGRLAPFPAAVASCGVSLPALPPPVDPLPGAPVGPPGPPAPGSRGKESCFLFFSGLSVKIKIWK